MVKEYKNKDSGFIGYTEMMSGSSHAIKTTTQPLLLWSYMRIALIAFYATFSISNTATTTLSSWHIDTESFLLYLLLNVVVWWMFFFFLFFFFFNSQCIKHLHCCHNGFCSVTTKLFVLWCRFLQKKKKKNLHRLRSVLSNVVMT